MPPLLQILPISRSLKNYSREVFISDLIAAVIVTILLIPQSLAYAMLAGAPAEMGLYASILPLLAYALLGTSRTLSVGPVAIVSLMTATAISKVVAEGHTDYLTAAITLSLLSGLFLIAMGALKLGFIANFLSHPVISGFILASSLLIAFSQLKHILGVPSEGDTLIEILHSLSTQIEATNIVSLLIGSAVIVFLYWSRQQVLSLLVALGLKKKTAFFLQKATPIVAILITTLLAFGFDLENQQVALVGAVHSGLPSLHFTLPAFSLIKALALPALLISIIGYVESVSVGKTLAARRSQKINPNQELIGLGAANLTSSLSGAFPVTGGFSRSIVNYDAGAITQAASIYAAMGIALASLFLTPLFFYLPKATLAATIIIAVLSLLDLSIFKKTWQFAKSDFFAVTTTAIVTLALGVEIGVACGVILSIALHLYRTSKPHIAEVGLIKGTEHFRNRKRYQVETAPDIISLRPDESLFFANASFLEDSIFNAIHERDQVKHIILMCSAINEIDFSALETLEKINSQLSQQGIYFHLSEVKGPVMDSLKKTGLLSELSGKIYLTQFEAFTQLSKQPTT